MPPQEPAGLGHCPSRPLKPIPSPLLGHLHQAGSPPAPCPPGLLRQQGRGAKTELRAASWELGDPPTPASHCGVWPGVPLALRLGPGHPVSLRTRQFSCSRLPQGLPRNGSRVPPRWVSVSPKRGDGKSPILQTALVWGSQGRRRRCAAPLTGPSLPWSPQKPKENLTPGCCDHTPPHSSLQVVVWPLPAPLPPTLDHPHF